jgi:hypothetical protein
MSVSLIPPGPPRAGPGWAGADGISNARHGPRGLWWDIGGKDGISNARHGPRGLWWDIGGKDGRWMSAESILHLICVFQYF